MASADPASSQPALWFAEAKDDAAAEDAAPEAPPASLVASTHQAVSARLNAAMAALEELYASVSGHPALVSVSEKTAKVTAELKESAAALKQRGYTAWGSVPEQPVVKTAMARLNHAMDVLGRVKTAAKDHVASAAVTEKVQAARERAAVAISEARAVVARLPSDAKTLADSSTRFLVGKAAQVDRRIGVHDLAASLAEKVKLEQRAAQATGLLQAGDERLGVSKTVAYFVPERVSATSAAAYNRTLDYLLSLKSHYLAVREGDKDLKHEAEPATDAMAPAAAVECM